MKLKKFLKMVKRICKEDNCHCGKCPMSYKFVTDNGSIMIDCVLAVENVDEWDIDNICKRAKAIEKLVKK